MRRWISCVALASLAAAATAACGLGQMPGTTLGTYEVTGQTQTNSCGLSAPDPWTFDVQLSQDGTTLYWNWMDGTSYLSGPVSGQSVTLIATEQVNVDGVDGGFGPCTMERDDTLTITLAEGSPPPTFDATIEYAFSVVSGSECADQLTSGGGQYTTIPCTIEYTVTASRQ